MASWAQGLPRGQHPKGLPPRDAGRRGGGRGCGGPCHPHVTVPPPANAAVTMPRGRIKAASSRVPLPACLASPPGQTGPGGSLKTSERNSLRSWWNYLEGAEGGRLEAGRDGCRFSTAIPAPSGAIFKADLMDGNPASAFGEQMQAPQEMRRTTTTWRCLRLSGFFSWIAVARPRECILGP